MRYTFDKASEEAGFMARSVENSHARDYKEAEVQAELFAARKEIENLKIALEEAEDTIAFLNSELEKTKGSGKDAI